jgi:hypothetical protein
MNPRLLAAAGLVCAAAALASPARAQTDTTSAPAAPGVPPSPTGEATPRTDAPTPTPPRIRRSMNAITYQEVQTARGVSDAYELIRSLRPAWLRTPRGVTSWNAVIETAVFLDGVRLGTLDAMKTIPAASIRSARLLTAVDARQKYGGDTSVGVIDLSTK